jgi:hypothetical protein
MARRKNFETPSTGRVAITLDKRRLKEIKKIGIEFEMPDDEVFELAIDLLINKFGEIPTDSLEKKGKNALFE